MASSDNELVDTTDSDKIKKPTLADKVDQIATAVVGMQKIMFKKVFITEDDDPNELSDSNVYPGGQGQPDLRHDQAAPPARPRSQLVQDERVADNWDPVRNRRAGTGMEFNDVRTQESVTTIYKGAVKCLQTPGQNNLDERLPNKGRNSSSDEDLIDTSDELMNHEFSSPDQDPRLGTSRDSGRRQSRGRDRSQSRLRGRGRSQQQNPGLARASEHIQQADANKAKVPAISGKNCQVGIQNLNPLSDALKTALYDEDYLTIGGHIDEVTQRKILDNQYVDFARLLPKDRLAVEEDTRMEMVNKGGLSYWVPVSYRENVGTITNFTKWEQAFRVFSNIYTSKFPNKAGELIQYNHVIYTASLMYVWDNVYLYDKEFRLHISRHPLWSWNIILQQAWNLRLREKLTFQGGGSQTPKNKSKEACRRYNKGLCMKGLSCHYEHRCTMPDCGKFGHGAHICQKRLGFGADFKHNDLSNNSSCPGNSGSNTNNNANNTKLQHGRN